MDKTSQEVNRGMYNAADTGRAPTARPTYPGASNAGRDVSGAGRLRATVGILVSVNLVLVMLTYDGTRGPWVSQWICAPVFYNKSKFSIHFNGFEVHDTSSKITITGVQALLVHMYTANHCPTYASLFRPQVNHDAPYWPALTNFFMCHM